MKILINNGNISKFLNNEIQIESVKDSRNQLGQNLSSPMGGSLVHLKHLVKLK
jgi:hypothetical protein